MRRPATTLRDDPAYAALKARIIARTGHHYYADKDELLADRLRRRFRARNVAGAEAYTGLLATDPAEWTALEAEITIGETFFFRYAEQFSALRRIILPDLIAARGAERTLRIWSAGCSTGAEPYSVAILAHELLGPALPDWRVSILGSDISAAALASARAAEYGPWALRTSPPEERARYFRRVPPPPGETREAAYALRPEYRRLVRFERRNLLELVDGSAPPQLDGFDLILCRNVLIYFEAETVAAIMRGLGRRLRPGGWLLIGHAEPNPAFAGWLDPVTLPGTVAYRLQGEGQGAGHGEGGGAAAPEPWRPLLPADLAPRGHPTPQVDRAGEPNLGGAVRDGRAPPPLTEPGHAPFLQGAGALALLPLPESGDRRPARGPGAGGPPLGPAPPGAAPAGFRDALPPEDDAPADPDLLDRVRALADAGATGEAWRALRGGLAARPTDPTLRFYEGLIAGSLGREAEAERALRAALYLEPGFVMAHYHLGLLLAGLGRRDEAARALDNALRLSQALPARTVLHEAGGATAAEIARSAAAARDGIGRRIVPGAGQADGQAGG